MGLDRPEFRIVQVDPFDDAAVAAWHDVVLASHAHDRGELATPWQLEEVRAAHQGPQVDLVKRLYSGEVGGQVVVAGEVEASLIDNTDHALVELQTHPDHRRRGYGSAMLAHLEAVASELGRTVLDAEAAWPYDGPPDGVGTASADFLTGHGFGFGLGDVARVLDLPVDGVLLDRLAAEAAPHHAAYTLRSWIGPVPEDLAESFAGLVSQLMVEAPAGDLDRRPASADVDALRRREEVTLRQGRTTYTSAALDADGMVVAYSNLATSRHDPDNAYQWGTLVRRDHRGHRLGLAVKVATLRLLQQAPVRALRLRTWNAEVNRHMVAVNELLGFRPVERLGEFQKRLR
jgi:GNAT superfamily N-acetyltransferase